MTGMLEPLTSIPVTAGYIRPGGVSLTPRLVASRGDPQAECSRLLVQSGVRGDSQNGALPAWHNIEGDPLQSDSAGMHTRRAGLPASCAVWLHFAIWEKTARGRWFVSCPGAV
jgi:hypothetical protein